jgi:hypothetical protein
MSADEHTEHQGMDKEKAAEGTWNAEGDEAADAGAGQKKPGSLSRQFRETVAAAEAAADEEPEEEGPEGFHVKSTALCGV